MNEKFHPKKFRKIETNGHTYGQTEIKLISKVRSRETLLLLPLASYDHCFSAALPTTAPRILEFFSFLLKLNGTRNMSLHFYSLASPSN